MQSVVAIVGRPNVGKSTLFNRLTGSRNAIISAYPGTTRDRQYGQVNLYGHRFILIDTGGIDEDKDNLTAHITKQAFAAIDDATVVLFVVDGKTGLTPADYNIADQLRKVGKPIVIAINKTESVDTLAILSEVHELGLGTPYPIAAAHGIGIESLVEALPLGEPESDQEVSNAIRLAIVGRPNAGKSTLTNRILGEERVIVSDTPGTTRDSLAIPMERHGTEYILIDTAGVRRRTKISEQPEKFSVVKSLQAIESSDVVLYLIDGRANLSDQDLKLLNFILESGRALVIAVNKWDHLSEDEKQQVKKSLDRQLDFVAFARVHFISALHGSGVGNLFDSVNEAFDSANKKLSTPEVTRLLELAIKSHQPPLVKGRRIKLRYAHPGGHSPPRIIIHGNQLQSLPKSYQRYLVHFFQTRLKLRGTPLFIYYKSSENPYSKK